MENALSLVSQRPEIENVSKFAAYLERDRFSASSEVRVFEVYDDGKTLLSQLNDDDLAQYLSRGSPGQTGNVVLRVFLLKTDISDDMKLKITSTALKELQGHFDISTLFLFGAIDWSIFTRNGMGCFSRRDKDDQIIGFEMFHDFGTIEWPSHTYTYFTYSSKENVSTYICINCPPVAETRLVNCVKWKTHSTAIGGAFIFDIILADEALNTFRGEITIGRHTLLRFENDDIIDLGTATRGLHRLSQDFYIIQKHLVQTGERIQFLRSARRKFLRIANGRSTPEGSAEDAVDESIQFLLHTSHGFEQWVANSIDRCSVRINLVFNQIQAAIASETALVAKETRRDSASMITIAAVTMFFLPGTFVCAIFSMSFFKFDTNTDGSEVFVVSRRWWLYLAVTIPLTVVVFGTWLGWQRWRARLIRISSRIRIRGDDVEHMAPSHLKEE